MLIDHIELLLDGNIVALIAVLLLQNAQLP
jgi:hypothetical protein